MTAAVEGPWDGSAFAGVRKSMSNSAYESEYKYEYPVKSTRRTKGIKPNSTQDWSKTNSDGNKISIYKVCHRL